MKAVRLLGNCQLEIAERESPKLRPGWVVLKMRVSAICGSDLHALYEPPEPVNCTPGHEFMGEVVEAGPESRVRPGERVAVYIETPEGKALGWDLDGGDAEYVLAPQECCLPVPPEISDDEAILVGDVIGVPWHQLQRVGVRPHELAVVSGLGPLGLGAVVVAKYLCCRVVGVDINPYRLDLARRLGADLALDACSTELDIAIAEVSRGCGIDVGIECAGRNESLNFLLDNAAMYGRVCLIGEHDHATMKPSTHVLSHSLTIFGSRYLDRDEFGDVLHLLQSLKSAASTITHRFPLTEAGRAFAIFKEGNTGKVVLLGG